MTAAVDADGGKPAPPRRSAWRTGCAVGCAVTALVSLVLVILAFRWIHRSTDRGHQLEQLSAFLPHDEVPMHYDVRGFKVPFNPVRAWIISDMDAAAGAPRLSAVFVNLQGEFAASFRERSRLRFESANETGQRLDVQGRTLRFLRLRRAADAESPLPTPEAPSQPSSDTAPSPAHRDGDEILDELGLEKLFNAWSVGAVIELSKPDSAEVFLMLFFLNQQPPPEAAELDRRIVEFLAPFHVGPLRNEEDL